MESQPQNPEFRNNPVNFHPCICKVIPQSICSYLLGLEASALAQAFVFIFHSPTQTTPNYFQIYRRIYCRIFLTLSNQMLRYKSKWVRIVYLCWCFTSQSTIFQSCQERFPVFLRCTSTKQRIKSLKDTTQCLRWLSSQWPLNLMSNTLPLIHQARV